MNDRIRERDVEGDRDRAGAQEPRVLETAVLFGECREIVLVHRSERYRLRVTQNGKLILTK